MWLPGSGKLPGTSVFAQETVQQETETPETEEKINTPAELNEWYSRQTGTDNKIGVISKELVITDETILLGAPITDGAVANRYSDQTVKTGNRNTARNPNHGPVQIKIQREKDGSGGIIRIRGNGSLIINDPNLLITGPDRLISVEGNGKLNLNQGKIKLDNTKPDTPAIVCRNKEQQIKVSPEFNEGSPLYFAPLPEPVPPDETEPQPEPDPPGQIPETYLTEALLMNINADGSGTARLRFQNLPPDITALYIYRSEDGKSWTKEKNRVETSAAQGGQGTAEYENFLKEPGNILNRSIVEDEYLTYRFQSDNRSFYVKARIEWPDGAIDTPKIRVAIPDYTGQGLTFSYGWGGYGGSGYGNSYNSYGSGKGSSYGNSSGTGGSAEGETDAPEGPIRRGGGRSRNHYTPSPPSQPSQSSPIATRPIATATPSNAMAAGSGISAGEAGEAQEDDGENAIPVQEPELMEENDIQSMESGLPGEPEENQGPDKKLQYTVMAAAVILLTGGTVFCLRHRRGNRIGQKETGQKDRGQKKKQDK
ncbi:hypothetical protein CBFG_05780 [Clostridiales bacterium 1_7_47FAA]|nr:hypothetical protein CBFG_05780 [Clostridiales bacterium 1_7_47FAA]